MLEAIIFKAIGDKQRRYIMVKLIGYARISTASQVGNTSIAHQKNQIEKFCQDHGYELIHIFEEQGSGENFADRPTWMMIQENILSSGDVDGIVCFNQSRVSRNTGEFCTFADAIIKAGKTIKIVADPNLDIYNSGDYFKFTIISAMDRKDRIDIVAKMQTGRANKAKDGGFAYGSPSFGYESINGELKPKESEQEAIEIIRRHRKSGKSYCKIASYLNDQGIPTKRGKTWTDVQVARIHKRLKAA
jgi:DNA invertase Pin-like site-specific DNA recombinase